MGSPFTCSKCGQHIVGNSFTIKGKSFCAACYNTVIQEKEKLESDKLELYKYICELFTCDECPPELISGIDRLLNNKYKISGIRGTLWFYYEIEGHKTSPETLPYLTKTIEEQYQQARLYIDQMRAIQKQNESVDINVPSQTVYIKPQEKKKKKFTYRMEDL